MSIRHRLRPFDDLSPSLDRFGALLALTVVALVTLSLAGVTPGRAGPAESAAQVVVTVFVGATLLLALRTSGVARHWLRVAGVLVGLSVLVTVTGIVARLPGATDEAAVAHSGTAPVLWIVLSALAPVAVIRRLLQHDEVTLRTVQGAVAAYLLIALAFFFAFLGVQGAQDDFFGRPEPTTTFMYFSLSTITTVGYGDLAAVSPPGRLLAVTEALVGQVFLVTFVALLVGLLGERWRGRQPGSRADDDPVV
ncbi:Ion channel [Geodermatophilus saharensis]|uniref:Ion channel n=1 Tax=Geodermatophilus saharensis TaxID=1137994 RepID=A0A239D8Z2_9ACTN|nr:potassium channel family protein [Geodermatophilus saharensis]SNS28759.1 Ion channel [Geodermatophilus saharensis]